jgi:predicted phosphodiesterase
MKILTVGDTHTKDFIIDIVEGYVDSVDRLVFLGDYVDEWDGHAEDSVRHLSNIIDFAKKYRDKTTLLLGNHDYAYVYDIRNISGHNMGTAPEAKKLFWEDRELFSIAYGSGKYLFSHAGVSRDWLEYRKSELDIKGSAAVDIAEALNELTFSDSDNILWDIKGYYGHHASGPLWIREGELLSFDDYHNLGRNAIIGDIIQVVGHTPVETVVKYNNVYIADTFSLYSNMEPIGDGSLLLIDTEKDDATEILSGYSSQVITNAS